MSDLAAGITSVLANPRTAQRAAALGGRMAGENGVATAIGHLEKRLLSVAR